MKKCITSTQPSQLAVSVGAWRRKFLRVKGVDRKGQIRGKSKRNWKLEIVFLSEWFRIDLNSPFLQLFYLVHKYLQSKKCRNLGRSRDLRHWKCAISENENQHAAYPFVTISLPLAFIVMSRSRPTQTCYQVPSLFRQGRDSTPGH